MTEPEKPVSDPAYWAAAYHEGRDGWELGHAAPPLARGIATIPVGQAAVVLGSGRAHEARLAASAGWPGSTCCVTKTSRLTGNPLLVTTCH